MKNYQQKLKELADILASDEKINNLEIEERMKELDLQYSDDPINQLNQVLLALHELKNRNKAQTNQEKHH